MSRTSLGRTARWLSGSDAIRTSALLVGSMTALALGMAGPVPAAAAIPSASPKGSPRPSPAVPGMAAPQQTGPSSGSASVGALERYLVVDGDTVSAVAANFGLDTASVLALNGLSWSSTIFPGQVLMVSGIAPSPVDVADSTVPDAGNVVVHAVASGETMGAIAERCGLATETLLDINGLHESSIIYPGQVILVSAGEPGIQNEQSASRWLDERRNAQTIIDIGRELGVPDSGIVVALTAAMTESGLQNLEEGDRDSVGLFQQRPSAGWGDIPTLRDPQSASRLFFGGPSSRNTGVTRGLLDIPGWESMTVAEAAQSVQVSAFPGAYNAWESAARRMLAELG